ncbi:MAG: methyltransferase domain-containing protein [Rhodoplanes sp.]
MTVSPDLQPDQQPARWDDHVGVYEAVFEPLTNAFARTALDQLNLRPGERLIDIGAGSGGAALIAAAEHGADVLAIDASREMVSRINTRAQQQRDCVSRVRAEIMDGTALSLPDARFDAAISVFGVILFPDAVGGMREIARILKPGGRVAVVTWTDMERYELATRLIDAIASVRGPQPPPSSLPAQLRFREEAAFHKLLSAGGLTVESITRAEEQWRLPSARWIAERIAFAPGLSALVAALGSDRSAIMEAFVAGLERDQGRGEVSLSAVAQIGTATKPLITNE